jgi:hypothetical protein
MTEAQLAESVEQLLLRHSGTSVVFDAAEALRELRRLGLMVEQQPAALVQQLHARAAAAAATEPPQGAAAAAAAASRAAAGVLVLEGAAPPPPAPARQGLVQPGEDVVPWAELGMLEGLADQQAEQQEDEEGDAAAPRYKVVGWQQGLQVRRAGLLGLGPESSSWARLLDGCGSRRARARMCAQVVQQHWDGLLWRRAEGILGELREEEEAWRQRRRAGGEELKKRAL